MRPGEAVVDTAAEEGVIGISQLPDFLQALEEHHRSVKWIKRIELSCPGIGDGETSISGIGDRAKHLGVFTAPYCIAGATGVWKVHVLKDDPENPIPPILSLPLIEALGMRIDLGDNCICLQRCAGQPVVTMRIVPNSRHRSISV